MSSTKIIRNAKIFRHVPILILAGSVYENVPDTLEKYLLPPRIIYVLYDFWETWKSITIKYFYFHPIFIGNIMLHVSCPILRGTVVLYRHYSCFIQLTNVASFWGKNISTYMGQLCLRHRLKIYFQNIVDMISLLHHWFLSPGLTSIISAASLALEIFIDSNL